MAFRIGVLAMLEKGKEMKAIRKLVAAAAAGGVAALALPAAPASAAIETSTGVIMLRDTGLGSPCIDLPYGSTADGTRPQLYTCDSGDAQKWTIMGDGTIHIADKCLDVAGGVAASGTPVQIADCNGSNAQKWTISGTWAADSWTLTSQLGSGLKLVPDTASTPPKLKISSTESAAWSLPTSYKATLQGNINYTRWVGSALSNPAYADTTVTSWPTDSTRGTKVAELNGTSDFIFFNTPGFFVSRSFTVSAWVKLNSATPGRNVTAVSGYGSNVSSFYLGYDNPTGKWAFKRMNADVNNSSGVDALSTSNATTGWTHLVGVYNDYFDTISLYVNGVHQSTQSFTGGGFGVMYPTVNLGRALWNGSFVDHFPGRLSGFRAWTYALNAWEINEVYVNG